MNPFFLKFIRGGLGPFLFIISVFYSFPSFAISDKIYKELETFTRLIEVLDQNYVDEIDEQELMQGAIRGMLASLDPHTVYLPPDSYKDFKRDTTGKYGGVGIEVTIKDGILTVVSPFDDSPAYEAGIRSGDRILKINGQSTKGMSLYESVELMRGHRGKTLELTIWHEGMKKANEIKLVRRIIQIKSVKSELIDDTIAMIRITSFQEKTSDEVRKALISLSEKAQPKLAGIILDLRNNPGGLLVEAVEIADLFLKDGVIVSTRDKARHIEVSEAIPNSSFESIPMVVLINEGSASASEIVAGALQDHKRAQLLGTTSFGKGSVQTILEMGRKSAIKLTIAKYYTPKGKSIDGHGIKPDIVLDKKAYQKLVKNNSEISNSYISEFQMKQALKYLKKTVI